MEAKPYRVGSRARQALWRRENARIGGPLRRPGQAGRFERAPSKARLAVVATCFRQQGV